MRGVSPIFSCSQKFYPTAIIEYPGARLVNSFPFARVQHLPMPLPSPHAHPKFPGKAIGSSLSVRLQCLQPYSLPHSCDFSVCHSPLPALIFTRYRPFSR